MASYTSIDNPKDYFVTHTYSGNDTDGTSTNNQTSLGMTPDLVWVKCRNHATPSHYIVDKVRGDEKYLSSNNTNAEATDSNTFELVSGGFNLGGGNGWTNLNGRTYVAWCWKAGTAFTNDASATSIGDIDSSGSFNNTSGFSICSYSGSGSSGDTIKHGLNTAPKIIIIKKRSATDNWTMLNTNISLNTHLHFTTASAVSDPMFNNTAPTTSVFTLDSDGQVNESGNTFIAYCFSEVQGYSKFGSYTGNGNTDGPFVYTGFRPAFVLQKNASATQGWQLQDNKRDGFNGANDLLQPHDSAAESGVNRIDILSNGFKVITTDAGQNTDGQKYVYWAFAEAPFVNSNGVPANAR